MPQPTRPSRRARRRSVSTSRLVLGLGVVLAAAVALAAVLTLTGRDSTTSAVVPTGEFNDMGLPVVEVPGSATGQAVAAGVEVAGATWSLGDVPLDTAVRPTWVLRNNGEVPVELGTPHSEVLQGCCPGPLSLDRARLEPGQSATLTFELAMHVGMGGWHEMAVHVPVSAGGELAVLTLGVTGDFR